MNDTSLKFWAEKYAATNPYTNVLALARSILASGTLITLLFNKASLLFPYTSGSQFQPQNVFEYGNFFYLFGVDHIVAAVTVAIVLLGLVIVGWLPQVTCVFHFWISYSFYRYCPIIEGGDQITSILTLSLIPILLFDNRFSHWSHPKETERPFVNILANNMLLFIQIQVAVVYLHAFVGKLAVDEWVNGTDTYYWFTHNIFGFPTWLKPIGEIFMKSQFVVTTITWGTIVLEILLSSAIFMSAKRKMMLFKAALVFHFGILLVHGLVSFFLAMTGALIIYLFPAVSIVFNRKLKNSSYALSRETVIN